MPARQPFTALCQATNRKPLTGRADLHLHTTHSDGSYTPAQVVDLARRAGLAAIAITDHDTLDGIAEAQAAAGAYLEIVPGVEITAEFQQREIHLLAYFIRIDDGPLTRALQRLRDGRVERFWEMVERLRQQGVALDEAILRQEAASGTLGRRNLAQVLARSGRVGSVREAFLRYLGDNGRVTLPKLRLPVEEALGLVRHAGGVAAWAHPSYDCNGESLTTLRAFGLHAIEVEYPAHRQARKRRLRELAEEFGLAITGGSDCHGPDELRRAVGQCGITVDELEVLRQRAAR